MLLFKEKINYKLANGGGFNAHLDAPAYDHIGKIDHLTANLAVDKATMENGCLEVVPKSHKMDVQFVTGGHITPEWESSHEWLPVPLDPGDILLFGSHLAHRSGPNKTSRSRSMVYATYHGVSDGTDLRQRYYADRRANFPPEHGMLIHSLLCTSMTDNLQKELRAKTTPRDGSVMLSLRPFRVKGSRWPMELEALRYTRTPKRVC
jgi:hypothetical protein